MALLDGLDRVNWRLHHAYGPAEDVPDLLRALADPASASAVLREEAAAHEKSVFEWVCWKLWGNVFHQGTVWQVTASTIPFFVEILRDGPRDVGLQRFLLSYLAHLAMGYPEDVFPAAFDPDREFASIDGLYDDGREPNYEDVGDPRPTIWQRDCYLAVEHTVPLLLDYVDDPDEETALEAMGIVTWFPRRASETVPRLLPIARRANGMRSGTAIVAAVHAKPRTVERGTLDLLTASDRVVAVHAACAYALAGLASAATAGLLTNPLGDLARVRSTLTRGNEQRM